MDSPKEENALELLNQFRDLLIIGVTNRGDESGVGSHLFSDVCPRLEQYDLASTEQLATHYQRYKLTSKGKALLVFIDKHQRQ
jgi:hypothetical protein